MIGQDTLPKHVRGQLKTVGMLDVDCSHNLLGKLIRNILGCILSKDKNKTFVAYIGIRSQYSYESRGLITLFVQTLILSQERISRSRGVLRGALLTINILHDCS